MSTAGPRRELLERIASLTQATRAEPQRADLHFELANACLHAGEFARAADAYAEALRLQPRWLAAMANLGVALGKLQRYAQAEAAFRTALEIAPDNEPVLCNLAGILKELGRSAEAAEVSRRAATLAPDQPEPWINLGAALYELNQLDEAADAYRRALAIAPGTALGHYNLGHVLCDEWRLDEAIASFERAVALDPGYEPAWHALLFTRLYDSRETEQSIFSAHQRWGQRFPVPQRPRRLATVSSRRMRVGYVSPDLRSHSCTFFLMPLLRHHDHAAVEVFAYSNTLAPDATTTAIRDAVDHWRDIRGLDEPTVAQQVMDDGIDVLVDLAGHTRNQPLGVFARRPAPVQIAWLGYPATSGLQQIDYRVTDELADPPGTADECHAERLARLPGGFLCYEPAAGGAGVNELPAARNGHVTFGSFNNIAKITPAVVHAWAAILHALPDARLLIKGRILMHAATRARLATAFAREGIDPARLDLRCWVPRASGPLAAYHEVDIALDTFPYNGTTTTFESLWMGVPVITLEGERHAGRVGASILGHLGRPEWIARDVQAYAALALRLASDRSALARERRDLRGALAASSLMDGHGFARRIEQLYRDCVSEAASPKT